MATRIVHRRGTASQWQAANPVLASGEFGYAEDTREVKLGDGVTPWNSLALLMSGVFALADDIQGMDSNISGLISSVTTLEEVVTTKAELINVVTGGASRKSGGAFHIFNDPATTPVGPVVGDLAIGDLA